MKPYFYCKSLGLFFFKHKQFKYYGFLLAVSSNICYFRHAFSKLFFKQRFLQSPPFFFSKTMTDANEFHLLVLSGLCRVHLADRPKFALVKIYSGFVLRIYIHGNVEYVPMCWHCGGKLLVIMGRDKNIFIYFPFSQESENGQRTGYRIWTCFWLERY